MESVRKTTHAASATMSVNVEGHFNAVVLSCSQKRRRKAKRKVRREDHSEASVRLGRDIEDRARITLMDIARNYSCDFLGSSRVSEVLRVR